MDQMRILVDRLNYLTKKYDEGIPEVSDKEWDDLYFQLAELEKESGIQYEDSPVARVNYQVVNGLKKVEHNHKMLSLDKTKSLTDVENFLGKQDYVAMAKLDGLTCSLKYLNGKLVSAETRGNGIVGEDVTHNAKVIASIPKRISYTEELIVDGEIICLLSDFQEFSSEYKNARNFAAGSIRLLDAKECAKRKLTFVIWDVIQGFDEKTTLIEKLTEAQALGFHVVPWIQENIVYSVNDMKEYCVHNNYPIDGIVFKFNNIAYGKAQGETAHHFKNAIAYKFYDEIYPTVLRDIDWSMGRTGLITPVAIFDSIDIDGSNVSRANLHNLSILKDLLGTPWRGQSIGIYKANMIIPQVGEADLDTVPKKEDIISIPIYCPVCGDLLSRWTENSSTFLKCDNPDCEGKLVNRLDHFCGVKGLDIKGLSAITLEKLIDWGWVNNLVDIYSLYKHKEQWIEKPGFGEKSVSKILDAIEASKVCTLDAFLAGLGIPLVGKSIALQLTKHFHNYKNFITAVNDNYDFTQLFGFAEVKSQSLLTFDYTEANQLAEILTIDEIEPAAEEEVEQSLQGLKFVITGSLQHFKNRGELQALIEKHGGKAVSGINKTVNYLINNNIESMSAKNIAAKQLGIPILTEDELLEKIG